MNIRVMTYNEVRVDDLGNITLDNEFNISLGSVTDEYRFRPSSIVVEQGITVEMMDIISELIRKKAGIGEKKAGEVEDSDEKNKERNPSRP